MCVRKLSEVGKEPSERSRVNKLQSSHKLDIMPFPPAGMENLIIHGALGK